VVDVLGKDVGESYVGLMVGKLAVGSFVGMENDGLVVGMENVGVLVGEGASTQSAQKYPSKCCDGVLAQFPST
jgi:hypothetical protein